LERLRPRRDGLCAGGRRFSLALGGKAGAMANDMRRVGGRPDAVWFSAGRRAKGNPARPDHGGGKGITGVRPKQGAFDRVHVVNREKRAGPHGD
jgi:hypothetical protein